MDPETLRQLLRAQPFVPIRLYLTDGKTYEVRHPEMMLVTQRNVFVGIEQRPGSGVAVECDILSLLHIVRIELVTQPPTVVANN